MGTLTSDALAGNYVFSLAVDNKGIVRADIKKCQPLLRQGVEELHPQGLMDDFVYSIGVDPDNNKWFGTRFGVSKLTEGNAG